MEFRQGGRVQGLKNIFCSYAKMYSCCRSCYARLKVVMQMIYGSLQGSDCLSSLNRNVMADEMKMTLTLMEIIG